MDTWLSASVSACTDAIAKALEPFEIARDVGLERALVGVQELVLDVAEPARPLFGEEGSIIVRELEGDHEHHGSERRVIHSQRRGVHQSSRQAAALAPVRTASSPTATRRR
jgi:hypothetical protein